MKKAVRVLGRRTQSPHPLLQPPQTQIVRNNKYHRIQKKKKKRHGMQKEKLEIESETKSTRNSQSHYTLVFHTPFLQT
jgi:hypothetical protein